MNDLTLNRNTVSAVLAAVYTLFGALISIADGTYAVEENAFVVVFGVLIAFAIFFAINWATLFVAQRLGR